MMDLDRSGVSYQPFAAVLPGILLLTFVFLLNFISRLIFAPLLPLVEQELGLSHTDSGSFFLFISSGYFVAILTSGFISARLGHRRTIILSTLVSGVVLCLLSLCSTLLQIRLGLFCLGLGAGFYLPSGLASITKIVSPAYYGRAIAVHELAPNLGFIAAPLLAALFTAWFSWSQSLALLGVVLLVVALLYTLYGSDRAGLGVAPNVTMCRQIVVNREFWVMALLFSMAICATLGLFTLLPLYLVVERGMGYAEANHLVSWSRVACLVMPFLGGWVGDRVGHRRVMSFVLLCVGVFTIPIGLASGPGLITVVIVQAMLAACFFPSGLTILSTIGGGRWGSVPLSLCVPLAFLLGAGVMPLCIGMIGDAASLGVGFVSAGVLCTLVGAAAVAGQFLSTAEVAVGTVRE